VDIEVGWVSLARNNLALAARHGATGRARVIHADATRLPAGVPADLRGTVDLVLTSAPAGNTMPARRSARHRAGPASPAVASALHPRAGRIDVGAGLGRVLAGCGTLLRPGGLAAITIARGPAKRIAADCAPRHVFLAGLRAGLDIADHLYANHLGQLITRYRGDDFTLPRAPPAPSSS
jgi:hypothetical protein